MLADVLEKSSLRQISAGASRSRCHRARARASYDVAAPLLRPRSLPVSISSVTARVVTAEPHCLAVTGLLPERATRFANEPRHRSHREWLEIARRAPGGYATDAAPLPHL